MTLIQKVKALWQARQVAESFKGWSNGFKTWHFWAVLLGQVTSLFAVSKGLLPSEYQTIGAAVLNAAYNLARGYDKAQEPGTRPLLKTTEFWMSVAVQASTALSEMQHGGIDNAWVAATGATIGAIVANRKMAHKEP